MVESARLSFPKSLSGSLENHLPNPDATVCRIWLPQGVNDGFIMVQN
jgi:hypothetical protein